MKRCSPQHLFAKRWARRRCAPDLPRGNLCAGNCAACSWAGKGGGFPLPLHTLRAPPATPPSCTAAARTRCVKRVRSSLLAAKGVGGASGRWPGIGAVLYTTATLFALCPFSCRSVLVQDKSALLVSNGTRFGNRVPKKGYAGPSGGSRQRRAISGRQI